MGLFTFFRNKHDDQAGLASAVADDVNILPQSLFDEQRYLAVNPDVAQAVAEGTQTAYGHYVNHGHREEVAGFRPLSVPTAPPPPAPEVSAAPASMGEMLVNDHAAADEVIILPQSLFDEQRYLSLNPDVAEAVAAGTQTAYDHYVTQGHLDEMAGLRPRSLPSTSEPLARQYVPEALISRLVDLELEKRALLEAWDRRPEENREIDFEMLTEHVGDALLPPLDRAVCDESRLDADQLHWREHGYVIKPGMIPDELIDRYCAVRERVPSPGGWTCPIPYMHVSELRDVALYRPLTQLLERLVGEEMGLHLNLTGWVSTDRNWHQDDYLNPPFINTWYAAVWIALDDIHPDCGPFEFVPGSHKWPLMRSHKVRLHLRPEERQQSNWPSLAERFINDVSDREIKKQGATSKHFIAKKGDVLIWHGRLMHRGSYANVPGMQRKTLISHFSGVKHRVDMPRVAHTPEGSAYFVQESPLDFDPYAVAPAA
jgi:hypothetical protein